MRYFKSLGSDGWKSAVLKIKMRKKLPAITITLTAVSIFCFLVLAEAFFMMTSGSFNALAAQRTASQAEQNARIEVKRLENLDYAELSYLAEHPRQVMDGVEDGNWESEVTLGPEKNLNDDDDVKIRLAHVSIYRTGDSVTRYDVDVPLTSATGTTPIGSVMTWTSEGKPTTGGVWLECNGQTIPSKYKRLRELLGDKTPDYRGMFLRGYGSQTAVTPQGLIVGNQSQTYQSGPLGAVQGDSTRFEYNRGGRWLAVNDRETYLDSNRINMDGILRRIGVNDNIQRNQVSNDGNFVADAEMSTNNSSVFQGTKGKGLEGKYFWIMTKPPKKYSLSGHGGDYAYYGLNESEDTETGEYLFGYTNIWESWNSLSLPVDSEIRPVNKAVRFFVKAR